jgi:hypothetical protein
MWILKGTVLGLWAFGFGTIAYLYLRIFRHTPPMPPGQATSWDFSGIGLSITLNPLWWATLVVCLILGLAITRHWSVPLGLWIVVIVTGVVPAGLLALILVLVYKTKQA